MNVLCVLARVPAPGAGKSRLRARLGDELTDTLARAFVEDVLDWATQAADLVVVAHEGAAALLPPPSRRCLHVAQRTGNLGDRIAGAVDAGFAQHAGRVVIVGTDCPTLPSGLLAESFSGLDEAASTLVPAGDGGWIALGVDRPLAAALDGVTWSSARTCADTIAALRADGRPPRVLPPWYDIDEPADLDLVAGDPRSVSRAPRTSAVIEAMTAASR